MRLFKRSTPADDAIKCPDCGEQVPDGAHECAMCGHDLRPHLGVPRPALEVPQDQWYAGLTPWRWTRGPDSVAAEFIRNPSHASSRSPSEAMAAHVTNPSNLAHAIVTAVRSLPRRLRGHWRATELDRALAAGVDPETTPEIAAHAESLRSRPKRGGSRRGRSISRSRTRALVPPPFSVRVPIAGDAVRRNRPELLALAAELRQASDVSACEVAAASSLVTGGTGPSTAMTAPTPRMPRSSK